ncbi:unnamed protein product [Rodentolepis nana]|uniref:WH1 domain-containing protein n=1 Tax=Rodentolepis nana TaxID=102285 RepID=A0A0R3TTB3_RODNA|nr:unnamed protein product [Rodentolepis nana]
MSDNSQDVESVNVNGATIGFLSSAAFSEDFYMVLNRIIFTVSLEIVAALPCDLRTGTWNNYASTPDSKMHLIGVYKCKKSGNAQWKFSVNDYKIMSIDSISLFFLIEAREDNSVVQKLFQVRNRIMGNDGDYYIRQIGFKIISIEPSNGNLYDVNEMQVNRKVNDLSKTLCSELKSHAENKLHIATENLSNTMEKLYNKWSYNPNGKSNLETCLHGNVPDDPSFSRMSTPFSHDRSVIEGLLSIYRLCLLLASINW